MSEFIKEGEKVVIKLDKDIVASNVEEIKKELRYQNLQQKGKAQQRLQQTI